MPHPSTWKRIAALCKISVRSAKLLAARGGAPTTSANCFYLWHRIYLQKVRALKRQRGANYYKRVLSERIKSNRPYYAELTQKYRCANRDAANQWAREWRRRNREGRRAVERAWYAANREKIAARRNLRIRARYTSDVQYRLRLLLGSRMLDALSHQKQRKSNRTIALVGCTIPELRKHLESLFQPGMSWQNHGVHGWHIDHKRPCISFDLSNPEQQMACFHYSNLQPLWCTDSWSKGARLDWQPPTASPPITQSD